MKCVPGQNTNCAGLQVAPTVLEILLSMDCVLRHIPRTYVLLWTNRNKCAATSSNEQTVGTAPAIGRTTFVRTVTAGAAAARNVRVSSTASLATTAAAAAVEVTDLR